VAAHTPEEPGPTGFEARLFESQGLRRALFAWWGGLLVLAAGAWFGLGAEEAARALVGIALAGIFSLLAIGVSRPPWRVRLIFGHVLFLAASLWTLARLLGIA
jgi:hypothetical protein